MLIAALLPLALFFLPMWNIKLEAPQYPDSIGMNIWINKITDQNPNDIKNINLLNHYVGMKYIPEQMEEFELFPLVVGIMSFLGVIVVFTGKKYAYLGWGIVMVGLGIAGLYDFYIWEYNYGHDLDPMAAIKIPGQGYQPPLIGSKMILNFKATSLPMLGGYLLFAGIALSFIAFYIEKKFSKK